MKNIQKEIVTIEGILKFLNERLIFHIKNYESEKIRKTISDIIKCETELKKLLVAKEGEKIAVKGNKHVLQRSRKGFSR